MAKVQSAEDLKDWKEYRAFLKERARGIPEEGCAFYVSKEKFEFDINGTSWSGYAILFDEKGTLAVQKLKKEQVKFREGTCTLRDGNFVIAGLAPNFVNFAQKTLVKMKLGYGAVPATDGQPGPSEPSGPSGGAGEGPTEASPPADEPAELGEQELARLRAALTRLEKKNLPRARELGRLVPDARQQITDSLTEATAAKKRGDLVAAVGAHEILDVFLDSVEKEAKEGGASDPKLQELLDRLKKKNLPRAKRMVELVPDARSQLADSLKEASDAEQRGDVKAAVDAHEILDAYLDSLEKEVEEGGADDPKLQALLRDLKKKNQQRAKEMARLVPDSRAQIAESLKEAAEAEKSGDVRAAVEAHEILDVFLDSLEKEAREGGAGDPRLLAALKKLKEQNGKRAKLVGDLVPDARKEIAASLAEAAQAEKAGDLKGAVDAHEILAAYLTSLESEILE